MAISVKPKTQSAVPNDDARQALGYITTTPYNEGSEIRLAGGGVLLGRATADNGPAEEITLGDGLEIEDGHLNVVGGAGGGSWAYSTIAGSTAAVDGTAYICNTAGGAFTLTLPASAAAGVRVGVIAPSSVETNALTINPNGQTFDGATTSFTVGAPCTLVFVKVGTEWRLEP